VASDDPAWRFAHRCESLPCLPCPTRTFPILIGLTTAMLLGHHGVPSLAIERHADTALHPRAGHFQLRTMDLLRQLGLEARVRGKSLETYSPIGGIIAAVGSCAACQG
jgi:FAD binding domain